MLKRILICILGMVLLNSCAAVPVSHTGFLLSAAVYPEMAAYPNEEDYIGASGIFDDEGFSEVYDAWRADKRTQQDQPEGYNDGLEDFYSRTIQTFLTDADGANRVYSPLNVFMALGMLAEVTDGESREQLLSLLGVEDMETLRNKAKAIWNANYSNDGAVTSILASSLWLDQDISYTKETLDRLAEIYYASSFQGEMGSQAYNKALQDWLNEQTGGMLEEQTQDVNMDAETILAMATTVFYRAKWQDEFSESKTAEGEFHLAAGDTVTCDFMHRSGSSHYYWEDNFAAVSLGLNGSGEMWFLLPDEGVSVDELLTDTDTMDFLFDKETERNSKYLIVNMAVPKFDVVSDIELSKGLRELGITDVFDGSKADFSPVTDEAEEIFLSDVKHAARVTIDEKGCTAAAYTVMRMAGAAMPPEEEVDFVLDRPFVFVITGADGMPLFVGVVNDPA
ncbi:MAG: serpin family protein [Clostridia bacterium]|nr:serpin family protein [Clostridia bacterium]